MKARKIILSAIVLLTCTVAAFSQVYVEGGGSLVFAQHEMQKDVNTLNAGTAFFGGIGFQKDSWLFGFEYARNFWNIDEEGVKNYKENYFLYKMRYQFLFSQIALTPNISLGVNYPQSNVTDFGDTRGFIARVGLDAEFIPFEKSPFIMFLGVNYNLSHLNGTAGSLDSHIGLRLYPFSLARIGENIAKKADVKKNGESEKVEKKIESKGEKFSVKGLLEVQTVKPGIEWIVTSKIPFHYEEDSAVYATLPQAQIDENSLFLNIFATYLLELGDYRVTIERYENNPSSSAEENINKLLSLSQLRAEAMLERLSAHGIQKKNMAATGKGGTIPQKGHFVFRVVKIPSGK